MNIAEYNHFGAGCLPISADQPMTMSSREIADLCEARHNDVVVTIERLFEKGILRESRNIRRTVAPEGRGRPMKVYDLTKRDSLVVASGYRDDLRARIIDRWMELEEQNKRPDPMAMLNDPAAMRGLLLTYSEKVIALEGEVKALEPKASALDRIEAADGSLCITDAAKTLKVRPKDLFGYLSRNGWIYKRVGTDVYLGYQSKIVAGLLEHKTTTVTRADGSEKVTTQVRVTAPGITRLAKVLVSAPQEAS